MKFIALALLFCAPLTAQSLIFLIDNSDGATPSSELPVLSSPYTFPDTPVGSSSNIVIRVWNPSTTLPVTLGTVFVGGSPNSSVANSNFTITGLDIGAIIAPQNWKLFTLNFTPLTFAPPSGYLQALEGGTVTDIARLQGIGTAAQITLTCTNSTVPVPVPQCDGATVLPPNTPTPLYFGNISTIANSAIQFKLTNNGSVALNPQSLVSLSVQTNNPNTAFSLGTLPTLLDPGLSTTFVVSFSPGTTETFQKTLIVGSNMYLLQGTGTSSTLGDISSLVITYTDATGVRLTAQPSSPIGFGSTGTATLSFTVTNPQTTINAVTIPAVSVTGSGFVLSGVPPMPAAVSPNQSITFQILFSESGAGTYNGTLSIGSRKFVITGTSPLPVGAPGSALSGIQLICGTSPCKVQTFTSQQQVHLTVQLDSAASVESIFTLAMTFTPSVEGVSDDPAVEFIAPINVRTLQMKMEVGSRTGTYNGQAELTFQTGTTAGTITFTLTYLEQPTTLATITIAPAQVLITSTLAQRRDPSLVITLNGYDNTYSIGQLMFTFYDTSGRVIPSTSLQASVVSTDFHQYFFGLEDLGGGFSAQATFSVSNGNVTQFGSVAVTVTNSAGSTTTPNQVFQ